MASKLPRTNIVTPAAPAIWPVLFTPDFQFKKETGEYKIRVRLSAEQAAPLIAQLDALKEAGRLVIVAELEEKLAAAKTGEAKAKARKALTEMKYADPCYKPAYDADGNETTDVIFSFKTPASYISKRDGAEVALRPTVVDGRRKVIPHVVPDGKGGTKPQPLRVYSGSIVRVSGYAQPFYTETVGFGVSLRLEAVQILRLAEGGGDAAAAFGDEEDGWSAEDTDSDLPSAAVLVSQAPIQHDEF